MKVKIKGIDYTQHFLTLNTRHWGDTLKALAADEGIETLDLCISVEGLDSENEIAEQGDPE